MSRFAVLGRYLVAGSSGRLALRLALPIYSAIGIAATVIFASSGLDASTVVQRAESSAATRGVLLALWSIACLPIVHAIVCTETNLFVRALPVPRRQLIGWIGGLVFLAETPWLVFWTRGGGPIRGLGATLIAIALHTCLVARIRKVSDAVRLALIGATWLVPLRIAPSGIGPMSLARVGIGAVLFAIGLPLAWQRAPERNSSRVGRRVGGSPSSALAIAHGIVLVRRHRAAISRAALIVVIGVGWTALAAINDESLRSDARGVLRAALLGWIPSCILAAATPLGPILQTEHAAEWLLAACATTRIQRRAATMGLSAVLGGAIGLASGAALGMALGSQWWFRGLMIASLAATGAILSALTEMSVRWATRGEGGDAGRLLLAMGTLIALGESLLWISLL